MGTTWETLKEAVKIKYCTFSGIIMARSGITFPLMFFIFQNVPNVGIRRGKGQQLLEERGRN